MIRETKVTQLDPCTISIRHAGTPISNLYPEESFGLYEIFQCYSALEKKEEELGRQVSVSEERELIFQVVDQTRNWQALSF